MPFAGGLQGVSHGIDFKNVGENLQNLAELGERGWFLNFLRAPIIV